GLEAASSFKPPCPSPTKSSLPKFIQISRVMCSFPNSTARYGKRPHANASPKKTAIHSILLSIANAADKPARSTHDCTTEAFRHLRKRSRGCRGVLSEGLWFASCGRGNTRDGFGRVPDRRRGEFGLTERLSGKRHGRFCRFASFWLYCG